MTSASGIDWTPGIGDPSIAGWLTVVAYAVAAVLARRCAQIDRPNHRIWLAIAVFELLLGINKQLDLQVLVTEVGRYLARQEAWYQDRREVQYAFIAIMAVIFAALIALIHFRTKARPPSVRIAMVGASVELVFIVLRASSFHHIDAFLGKRLIGAVANVYFENFGILIVIGGACLALNSRRLPRA